MVLFVSSQFKIADGVFFGGKASSDLDDMLPSLANILGHYLCKAFHLLFHCCPTVALFHIASLVLFLRKDQGVLHQIAYVGQVLGSLSTQILTGSMEL